MSVFNEGDIVVLRSGSPDMVVEKTYNSSVDVLYFSDGSIQRDTVEDSVIKSKENNPNIGTEFNEQLNEMVNHLTDEHSGPYIGNMKSPVLPNPGFMAVLRKYNELIKPRYLSSTYLKVRVS